jgi:50S ribosomal subunit-associated GTPase HflX
VFVSTVTPEGTDPLRRALQGAMRQRRPLAQIHLSHSDGKLLAEIHQYGEVLDQRTIGDEMVVRARVGEKLEGRLRRAGARVDREDSAKT